MKWVVVAAVCAVVYLNSSCDPDREYFNRKPLACYHHLQEKQIYDRK